MNTLLKTMLFLSVLSVQGQTRIIPHVTAPGGGYQTTIYIENLSNEEGTFRLVPYSAGGGALRAASGTIEPLTVLAYAPSQLFQSEEGVSHFVITTSTPVIRVTVSYRIAEGQGSPAHLSETDSALANVMVYPGEWDAVFDGLALVNMGQEPAQISLRQVDFGGNSGQLLTVSW